MKHSELVAELRVLLAAAGIELESAPIETMIRHMEYVLHTNQRLNLTAVRSAEESLRLHVLDSVMPLPEVSAAPGGPLIDIGTGGGYPGIPLALATGRQTLLLDSVKKKVEAIRPFLVQESLDSWISVSGERAEELALRSPGTASVVVARAVAPLSTLVELAAPLLVSGGTLIALKARPDPEEMRVGASAAAICGLEPAGSRTFDLPGGGELRTIVRYVKTDEPRITLPRRAGMANKRPLGV